MEKNTKLYIFGKFRKLGKFYSTLTVFLSSLGGMLAMIILTIVPPLSSIYSWGIVLFLFLRIGLGVLTGWFGLFAPVPLLTKAEALAYKAFLRKSIKTEINEKKKRKLKKEKMDPYFDQTMTISMNGTMFDEKGNGSCVPPAMDPAINIVISIIYVTICVVGLLGNTLVIYVVLRFSKMQTVTNIYIVNLALADECYLIGIPFLVTTSILKSWKFGGYMCRMYMTTIGINQFTSSTFITIMSADRYIAICHPISSPKLRTPFISKIVAGAAWTISVIMILPIILYSDAVKDGPSDSNHYSCNIIWPTSNSSDYHDTKQLNTFTIYTFVLSFAIPLTLIFICYVLVVRKLQTVGPKNKSKEKKRSHRKVTKLILTVITVYVFCWLPYWIAQLVLIFQSSDIEEGLSCPKQQGVSLFLLCHLIANLLSNANSAMNPVLYAFLSDNFKKSFVKACICAANKDVNAALQIENSVFPKRLCRSDSERKKEQGQRSTSICTQREEKNEEAQLVSKSDPSNTVSRSNITYTSDLHLDDDSNGREEHVKNGLRLTLHPTHV